MNWDLIIKALALFATTIAAVIGASKYFYEKNREVYIRRLNEVYAPLFGYLVKQETIRKLYLSSFKLEDAPILEFISKSTNSKFDLVSGKILDANVTENKILDRESFYKILNNTNKGLARPELLKLLSAYEILVFLENTLEKNSDEYKKATSKKVEVEIKLFREVAKGYEDTITKLQLDDSTQIIDLENFNI